MLLICAVAVPDVAVTNSRWAVPLPLNRVAIVSMIRDLPVLPSPPMNSQSCGGWLLGLVILELVFLLLLLSVVVVAVVPSLPSP